MTSFFETDLLERILDVGAANGWSATITHTMLRNELTDQARARKLTTKGAEELRALDKRNRAYPVVGVVYMASGHACSAEYVHEILGLGGVDAAMHGLVTWALPDEMSVAGWSGHGRERGARVALSASGVATYRFEFPEERGFAEIHVHTDPVRAEAHLRQIKDETAAKTFPPGTRGAKPVVGLVRKGFVRPKLSE